MRFNPAHVAAFERIEAGAIGEVRRVRADFSFDVPYSDDHRLWNREMGGGALLDVGIYPFTLAWWLLGEPETVTTIGHVSDSGVDDEIAMLCGWPGGVTATLTAAIRLPGDMTARIEGTDGSISFGAPAHAVNRFTIRRGPESETVEAAPASLHHQVAEVHRCLAAGERESPRMPWATSRAVMARFDQIRAELGVRYDVD